MFTQVFSESFCVAPGRIKVIDTTSTTGGVFLIGCCYTAGDGAVARKFIPSRFGRVEFVSVARKLKAAADELIGIL